MYTVAGMLKSSGTTGDGEHERSANLFLWVNGLCHLHVTGGPATLARLNAPTAISSDGAGGIFFTDRYVHSLRRVFANGTIITVAGVPGSAGYLGDGGSAKLARLSGPFGAALDTGPRGGVFIAVSDGSGPQAWVPPPTPWHHVCATGHGQPHAALRAHQWNDNPHRRERNCVLRRRWGPRNAGHTLLALFSVA